MDASRPSCLGLVAGNTRSSYTSPGSQSPVNVTRTANPPFLQRQPRASFLGFPSPPWTVVDLWAIDPTLAFVTPPVGPGDLPDGARPSTCARDVPSHAREQDDDGDEGKRGVRRARHVR